VRRTTQGINLARTTSPKASKSKAYGLVRIILVTLTTYNLHGSIDEITADILEQIKEYVLPAFDVLKDRESILEKRREYRNFDTLHYNTILLQEAMIYGRMGDLDKASELFNLYYLKCKKRINPNKGHLDVLEKLADELKITLKDS